MENYYVHKIGKNPNNYVARIQRNLRNCLRWDGGFIHDLALSGGKLVEVSRCRGSSLRRYHRGWNLARRSPLMDLEDSPNHHVNVANDIRFNGSRCSFRISPAGNVQVAFGNRWIVGIRAERNLDIDVPVDGHCLGRGRLTP